VIFVDNDFSPFCELIDFRFGLLLSFYEFLNVFFELGFFIDKFESFVIVIVDFFDHGLSVVVNVLVALSFGEDLIFLIMK
jgi:hypothetical protein